MHRTVWLLLTVVTTAIARSPDELYRLKCEEEDVAKQYGRCGCSLIDKRENRHTVGCETPSGTLDPRNPQVHFFGRVTPSGPVQFDHPGVSFTFTVVRTAAVSVEIEQSGKTGDRFRVIRTDNSGGEPEFSMLVTAPGRARYEIGADLDKSVEYTFAIYKDSEVSLSSRWGANTVTLHSLNLDPEGWLRVADPQAPSRRIECLGDSITAGFGSLCEDRSTTNLQQDSSHWFSWCSILGRKIADLETRTVAWSGRGLVKNRDGKTTDTNKTMNHVWRRTLASTLDEDWDFSSWTPDALLVALGENDYHATGGAPTTDEWTSSVRSLVAEAKKGYGNHVQVFFLCGPMSDLMCADTEAAVKSLQSDSEPLADTIHFFNFYDLGLDLQGCFGRYPHPSKANANDMAEALAPIIKQTLGWE